MSTLGNVVQVRTSVSTLDRGHPPFSERSVPKTLFPSDYFLSRPHSATVMTRGEGRVGQPGAMTKSLKSELINLTIQRDI